MTITEMLQMLVELERAYYSGTLIVKYQDKEVHYNRSKDLLKAIYELRKEIQRTQGKVPLNRFCPKITNGIR